jgi:hypothetical protein
MMQRPDTNLHDEVRAYTEYYRQHPFEKNSQTQKFKRWLRSSLYTVQEMEALFSA